MAPGLRGDVLEHHLHPGTAPRVAQHGAGRTEQHDLTLDVEGHRLHELVGGGRVLVGGGVGHLLADQPGEDLGGGACADHVHQSDGRCRRVRTEGPVGRGVGLHDGAVTVHDQDGGLVGVEEVTVEGLGAPVGRTRLLLAAVGVSLARDVLSGHQGQCVEDEDLGHLGPGRVELFVPDGHDDAGHCQQGHPPRGE